MHNVRCSRKHPMKSRPLRLLLLLLGMPLLTLVVTCLVACIDFAMISRRHPELDTVGLVIQQSEWAVLYGIPLSALGWCVLAALLWGPLRRLAPLLLATTVLVPSCVAVLLIARWGRVAVRLGRALESVGIPSDYGFLLCLVVLPALAALIFVCSDIISSLRRIDAAVSSGVRPALGFASCALAKGTRSDESATTRHLPSSVATSIR